MPLLIENLVQAILILVQMYQEDEITEDDLQQILWDLVSDWLLEN
jgi:hypothetical protein